MRPVEYDDVAATYDQRYARQAFDEVGQALLDFIGDAGRATALEIGCGTGHWLHLIATNVATAVGVDRSWEMLQRARTGAPAAILVQASAEHVPLADAQCDRASQLMVISDDEFAAGMRRLESERPILRADLRLYGTFATVPA